MDSLGDVLRRRMGELGLSQGQVVQKTGVSESLLSKLVRGLRTNMTAETIMALATGLGLDAGMLTRLAAGMIVEDEPEVAPDAAGSDDTEPGAAALLADEALQRALGVYPLSDDDRVFLGGLRLGCGREVADAARWLGHFRAWQQWVRSGADSAPAGG